MPYMHMAKIGGKYHLLDMMSVVSQIFETGKQEPSPADADAEGYVAVYNASKNCWEKRFWFDFPLHSAWSEAEREQILKQWPKWRKIYKVKTSCGLDFDDKNIVLVGEGGINVNTQQVCQLCKEKMLAKSSK